MRRFTEFFFQTFFDGFFQINDLIKRLNGTREKSLGRFTISNSIGEFYQTSTDLFIIQFQRSMHDMLVADNISWYIQNLQGMPAAAVKESKLVNALKLQNPMTTTLLKVNMFLTVLGKMYRAIPKSCAFKVAYGTSEHNYDRTNEGDFVKASVFDSPFSCDFEKTSNRWIVELAAENPSDYIPVSIIQGARSSTHNHQFATMGLKMISI